MNKLKNLSDSFDETLKDSNLAEINADLYEVLIDSFLKDGIVKDIPIIGTILKLSKFSMSLKEHLFLKKIIYFISELKDISPKDRNKMISELDESKVHRIKVGEKLIYIIDKCEDHVSTEYVAKFFKSFLLNKISYSDFLRCTSIIQNIFIEDFECFVKSENLEREKERNEYFSDIEMNFVSAGLCGRDNGEISVRDQDDWKASDKYVVVGGRETLFITEIGKKIKDILK